jgi:beta-glucosidase
MNDIKWPKVAPASLSDEALETEVSGLLDSMSIAQKVGQMIQPDIRYITPAEAAEFHIGSVLSGGGAPPHSNQRARVGDWLAMADDFHDALLENHVVAPLIWGIDALHGNNNLFGATLFPHNIGLGASRNTELVRQIAAATALEVAVTGLDWTFAPTLAVTRDDRWGRTYESFSEDPNLVELFSAPATEGYQGVIGQADFLCGPHILATAKHYLGDGGTEYGVDQGDNLCDEQTLRDVHGRGYFESIKAGVQTVMASFSSWQGNKMHGHRYLLQTVLKDQIGFDGFIVSDWNGHGQLAASSNVKGEEAINAGIDMLMAPEDWRRLLHNTVSSVEAGAITEARINDAVQRILRVKLRAGLRFPNKPSARPVANQQQWVGCDEHRQLGRQAVRESAVLLKNDAAVLPLNATSKILVAGPAANNIAMQCGGWSVTWQGDEVSNDEFPGATSVFAAINKVVSHAGGSATLDEDAQSSAGFDAVVMVFGEYPYAEGQGDREHLSFSSAHWGNLLQLRSLAAAGVPVVSIFLSGRPMWVNPELNASAAFIAAWLPGTEGQGLADLLFAQEGCDFLGSLSFSWPRDPQQMILNIGDEHYDPLFPLGFGLRYSDNVNVNVGGELSEVDTTRIQMPVDELKVFDLRAVPPFKLYVGDAGSWHIPVKGRTTTSEHRVVEIQTTDWQRQEDARRIRWSGGAGQLLLASDVEVDCSVLFDGATSLHLTLCVHAAPTSKVILRQESGYPHTQEFDITSMMHSAVHGEWHTVEIPLTSGSHNGFAARKLTTPFLLWTEGTFEMSLSEIRIEKDKHQAVA